MTVRRVLPVACAFMLVAAVALMPYGCSSSSPTQPGAGNNALTVSGQIAAVNNAARTFTMVDDSRTYRVANEVPVEFYGLPDSTAPTLEVLHPGDEVEVRGTESVRDGGPSRIVDFLVVDLLVTKTADGEGDSTGVIDPPPPPPPPDPGTIIDTTIINPYDGGVLASFRAVRDTDQVGGSTRAVLIMVLQTVDLVGCNYVPLMTRVDGFPDPQSPNIDITLRGIPKYECRTDQAAPAFAYHGFGVEVGVAYTVLFRKGDQVDQYTVTIAEDMTVTWTPESGSFSRIVPPSGVLPPPPPPPPPHDTMTVEPYTGRVKLHFRIAPTEWPSHLALLVLEMETFDSMSCPGIPLLSYVDVPEILSQTTEIGVVIRGIPQYECFRYDPAPARAFHGFPIATDVAYTMWFRNGDLTDTYQVTVSPDNQVTVTPGDGQFTTVATTGGWTDPIDPPPPPPDTGTGEPPPPPPPGPDSLWSPIDGNVDFNLSTMSSLPDSPFVDAAWWVLDMHLETELLYGCSDLPIHAVDSWTEESASLELIGTPQVVCPAVLIAPATLERRFLFKSRSVTLTFVKNGLTDVFTVDRDPDNGLTVTPTEGQFMRLRTIR